MKMLRYMNFKPCNYFPITWGKSELQEDNYLPIIVLESVFNSGLYDKEQSRGLFRNSSTKVWTGLEKHRSCPIPKFVLLLIVLRGETSEG